MWEETAEKIPTQGCMCRKSHQGTFLPAERKSLKGQREILTYNNSSEAHKLMERDSPNQIWFQEAEKPKQTRNHTEKPYSQKAASACVAGGKVCIVNRPPAAHWGNVVAKISSPYTTLNHEKNFSWLCIQSKNKKFCIKKFTKNACTS